MKLPTDSKQNGSLITGLSSTTQSALTRPLISALRTSHTSATQRYEKRHEQKPDASQPSRKPVLKSRTTSRQLFLRRRQSSNKHPHRRYLQTQNEQTLRLFVHNHRYLINETSKLIQLKPSKLHGLQLYGSVVDTMTDWHSEALCKYFCLITTHSTRRRKNVLPNLL